MTIDEAIEKHKKLKILAKGTNDKRGAFYSAEEHEQLADWLEELKALRNGLKIKCDSLNDALEKGKKVGYNKALDDFVNTVKATFPHDNIAICNTEVIAEKLKEGESE